jgi:hypothetical protein
MLIKRDILREITEYLERKEYIAITGPRQSGKTTLLEMLKKYLIEVSGVSPERVTMITFEDRIQLMEFERAPVEYVKSYMTEKAGEKRYLLIDEFQYAEDGGQKLKFVFDSVPDLKIIITGSSSLEIKAHIGKYMVGRIFDFNLLPFCFGEFLRAKDGRSEKIYRDRNDRLLSYLFEMKDPGFDRDKDVFHESMLRHYEEHCVYGGYPQAVLSEQKEIKRKVIASIYNNYVLKDIRSFLELDTEQNIFLLTRALSAQVGSTVVYKNLSNTCNMGFRELKYHLKMLEETFILKAVRPFFRNRQKELVKNPKIYLLDNGFRNYLMENFNSLDARADKGPLVENSVYIRLNELFGGVGKINFWRTKGGAEVDFVLHLGEEIIPVEVKFAPMNSPEVTRSFDSFIHSFKPGRGIILTRDLFGKTRRNGTEIVFIPVYYL